MTSRWSDFVHIERTPNGVGRITLDRPKALNALDLGMVRSLAEALLAWRDDPAVMAVAIRGTSKEGPFGVFCAGGDIRFFHQAALAGDPRLEDFFTEEYGTGAVAARARPGPGRGSAPGAGPGATLLSPSPSGARAGRGGDGRGHPCPGGGQGPAAALEPVAHRRRHGCHGGAVLRQSLAGACAPARASALRLSACGV